MARATDDERRLVEGRLRELVGKKVPCDIDCHLAEAVMGHDFCETPCDGCLSKVITRLADLIEPSCDREALLALAKWLDARATDLLKTNSIDHSRRRVSARKEHAMDLMTACSLIREACGVES